MNASHKKVSFVTTSILSLLVCTQVQAQEVMSKSWGHQAEFGMDVLNAFKAMPPRRSCNGSGVTVAVIDTGIDPNHPDLRGSLWVNQKEARGKKAKDEDGNGFVDDVNGWDFVSNTPSLVDTHGHGTHIAGIIGAKGASSSGFSGVCPGVRIMALRYYNEKASGVENLRNTVRAIEYAVQNGANIINYSGGGAEFSQPEYRALKKAEEKGILVVAAAGNERSNADVNLYFPAAYPLQNIVSVTAINQAGFVLPSSNWGVQRVHIAAPGNSVLSTLPNGGYGFMTGTSQATAFVSGLAAYLLADNGKLKVADLKRIILSSARKHHQLVGKTQTGAAANAPSAIAMARGRALAVPSVKKPASMAVQIPARSFFVPANPMAEKGVVVPSRQ
jgi:thermitase